MENNLKEQLAVYFKSLMHDYSQTKYKYPITPWHAEADRALYIGEKNVDGWVCWKPKEKTTRHDLTELSAHAGFLLHESLYFYVNSYWFFFLGGEIGEYSIELTPIIPGAELQEFIENIHGYNNNYPKNKTYVPIGIETNLSLLVVINNKTGEIFIHDYETDVVGWSNDPGGVSGTRCGWHAGYDEIKSADPRVSRVGGNTTFSNA